VDNIAVYKSLIKEQLKSVHAVIGAELASNKKVKHSDK
jgi:hypothetical protein